MVDHLGIQKLTLSASAWQRHPQKSSSARELIDCMVMAGAIDGSWLMHLFAQRQGRIMLPYRAIYWLFSFIVLPRRNHRLSRWIFRRQSRKLTQGEYLKWVELYKPFFKLVRQYVQRPVMKKASWSWATRITFFSVLPSASLNCSATCG